MNAQFTAERSGVYRTPADVEALREAVELDVVAWSEVDLAGVGGKAGLLERVAGALRLPAHFGGNWDALADSLQDLPITAGARYVMRLRGAEAAKRALDVEWGTFLEILGEAADYWKERQTAFVAFVDGASELPPWK